MTEYVHKVGAAIPDIQDSWEWESTPDLPDDVIEISDAAIALSVWLDQTEPGHQGVITLPDGQMLAWHEAEGWTLWSEHGVSTPLGVAIDATPDQVARAAARL